MFSMFKGASLLAVRRCEWRMTCMTLRQASILPQGPFCHKDRRTRLLPAPILLERSQLVALNINPLNVSLPNHRVVYCLTGASKPV